MLAYFERDFFKCILRKIVLYSIRKRAVWNLFVYYRILIYFSRIFSSIFWVSIWFFELVYYFFSLLFKVTNSNKGRWYILLYSVYFVAPFVNVLSAWAGNKTGRPSVAGKYIVSRLTWFNGIRCKFYAQGHCWGYRCRHLQTK